MTTYLDCNATTPVSPDVAELVMHFMVQEYGNSGSRTHEFGLTAKKAVERAREQVSKVIAADKSEVYFTSGATESNNIAILGLLDYGNQSGKKHIITSTIEHKAVLEPIAYAAKKGFDVTYLPVDETGIINPKELEAALRPDTLLISLMHINNETGSIQDLDSICDVLKDHQAYLHVDAAQSFGKYSEPLQNQRLDLISISGHKVYAPKGIGALIVRRRGYEKIPLVPIMYGGGQEKGLRPGTLPVSLIAGLGLAAENAYKNAEHWRSACLAIKNEILSCLTGLDYDINGDNSAAHVLNISIKGLNSEAAMVALKGLIAVSNGSACTSQNYSASHVLKAMGLDDERIESAIRISWCHMTKDIPLMDIKERISGLL